MFNHYDTTVTKLAQDPNSLVLKHKAVLALAQAGSLDFALSEYGRYGLDKVTTYPDDMVLEDIMGLGGRLSKDLFLLSSGKVARDHALQSAEKYEAAFKATRGYYSGINAATMALMAGMPKSIIKDRVRNILHTLPASDALDVETRYFIEATRSEAFLLLGEPYRARENLHTAILHDPLNYVAHASTLRQFKMILEKQAQDTQWLSHFAPPKSAYFAGHIFKLANKNTAGALDKETQDHLKIQISDAVQQNDIGFGYGALAAGSDITIAEVLLDEGCELHITLPVAREVFIKHSVKPFGDAWVKRFEFCWDVATSRDIATNLDLWPQGEIDRYSANVAMGKAILQSKVFNLEPVQLLTWDGQPGKSGTARAAADWQGAGRTQITVPYPYKRISKTRKLFSKTPLRTRAILTQKGHETPVLDDDIYQLACKAFDEQNRSNYQAQIGLHVELCGPKTENSDIAQRLAEQAVVGSVLASEEAVSMLLIHHETKFSVNYIGRLPQNNQSTEDALSTRIFALTFKT